MSAPKSLSDEQRTALLRDLTSLKTDDDDAVAQDPKWFLPLDAHARALRPETLVVRGGRGAGKTALFHFLGHVRSNPALGASASLPSVGDTDWVEGFSTAIDHPNGDAVGAFAESATDARRRHFWFGWLCSRISSTGGIELPTRDLHDAMTSQEPVQLADAAGSSLSVLSSWLDGIERSRGSALVITYDGLDRIGASPAAREQLTASLIAMWLALTDRYRHIRPKIFVREDLFTASTSAFPDASKVEARSVSLEWSTEDLYRVLIKHMANLSEGLRAWLEECGIVPLHETIGLGWTLPPTLAERGQTSQKNFADRLAGEKMGSVKQAFTYRWIPNRLQDARSRIVPRSMLSLIRNAARVALECGASARGHQLLHHSELRGALVHTSNRRVAELKEEFPVVLRLEHLRDRTVMLDRKEVVAALSQTTNEPDGHGEDGERVLRTLIDLGVMSVRRLDGRIDVPDIYRYGFGIKRKGGVKRPR